MLCAAFLFAGANAVAKALYMRGHTLVSLLLVGHTQLVGHTLVERLYLQAPVELVGHTLVGQAPVESATRPSSCVVAL